MPFTHEDQEDAGHYQDNLEAAIGSRNAVLVHDAWSTVPSRLRRITLLSPSKKLKHQLRTPLMTAAATGDMSIMGAILAAFEALFPDSDSNLDAALDRKEEMERQLEMLDINDMTLLMHASASGCSKVFNAVAQEVGRSQFRKIIPARDAKGRTFLHHATNARSDDHTAATTPPETRPSSTPPPSSTPLAPPTPPTPAGAAADGANGDASRAPPPQRSSEEGRQATAPAQGDDSSAHQPTPTGTTLDAGLLDPWVPVVNSALEFAKKNLCKAEYRRLLLSRDAWKRSIVEHSIMSGRRQVFETVFDAMREDVYDDEIDALLDSGVESSYEQNAMSIALSSPGGRKVAPLIAEKTKNLKKDVSLRASDSSVTSKIQAFIPGNLIVIFQLLLPEFKADSDDPLILLLVLCAIAPFWSWASTVSKMDPQVRNTRARQTGVKHVLAIPAIFFWGVGTSTIGSASFNWDETASAAALAVATIVIPALDSFFTGRGARRTNEVVTIASLNLWDWLCRTCPFCKKSKKAGVKARSSTSSEGNRMPGPRPPIRATQHVSGSQQVQQVEHSPPSDAMEAGGTEGINLPGGLEALRAERGPRVVRSGSQGSVAGSIWEGDTQKTG